MNTTKKHRWVHQNIHQSIFFPDFMHFLPLQVPICTYLVAMIGHRSVRLTEARFLKTTHDHMGFPPPLKAEPLFVSVMLLTTLYYNRHVSSLVQQTVLELCCFQHLFPSSLAPSPSACLPSVHFFGDVAQSTGLRFGTHPSQYKEAQ